MRGIVNPQTAGSNPASPAPSAINHRTNFMELFTQGISKEIKYLHTERGIAYFEEGWWMHEQDRLEMNHHFMLPRPMRGNEETKQISPDDIIYP